MKLLAVDTSTDACSVALTIGEDIIQQHRIASQQHAALVLPMIESVMAEAQLKPADLGGIVYGKGPGSFTGVRIAASVTQGIALGAEIGVLGISTLHSIAQGCLREYGDEQVSVSIDARMDEVYFGAYRQHEHTAMAPIIEENLGPPDEVLDMATALMNTDTDCLHQSIKKAVWAGSGAERYADILNDRYDIPRARIRQARFPQARDLLTLAMPEAMQDRWMDPATAIPVYLRNKVAQTTQERTQQKN